MNINITFMYNPIITSQLPHPDSPHHYTSWPMTTRTLALDSAGRGQSSNFNSATTIDYCCCYKQKNSTDLEAGLVWFGLSIREFHHIIFEDRTFKNQNYGWNLNKDMYWWGQQYVRESWRTTGLSLVSHITMNAVQWVSLMIRTRREYVDKKG